MRLCSIDGCDKKHLTKGFCSMHNRRILIHGNPHTVLYKKHTKTINIGMRKCSIDGCDGKHLAKGFCTMHYGRFKRHGDPSVILTQELCCIDGCGVKHKIKGYCGKHFQRLQKGLDLTTKTKYETTTKEKIESNVCIDFETGCWNWLGSKNTDGYGNIGINKKSLKVHRVSYEIFKAPIPYGMCVCHHCDNPGCCNPGHLFIGTHKENMNDRDIKNRGNQPKGSRTSSSKLIESDVMEIRKMISEGARGNKIAKQFNIACSTLNSIKHNRSWKHVELKK